MSAMDEVAGAEVAGAEPDIKGAVGVDLSKYTVKELQARLRELKLPVTGPRKAVLVERLKAAMREDSDEDGEIDDDEDGESEAYDMARDVESIGHQVAGEKVYSNSQRSKDGASIEVDDIGRDVESIGHQVAGEKVYSNSQRSKDGASSADLEAVIRAMSRAQPYIPKVKFQDVADTIPSFSGDKGGHVQRWLAIFEATADMANWGDVEKMINAKRKFVDSARLFSQYECKAKTWSEFKRQLVKEFGETVNSKQVHKQLATTKKQEHESLQEFVYRMLEIGSQINIELEAQIQYIVEGIPDEERNKTMLYGASSIKELRKKLREYEIFKSRLNRKTSERPAIVESNKRMPGSKEKSKRCFNCGGKDHLSSACPEKQNGPKCFNCGEYGHIAPKCVKAGKNSDGDRKNKVRVDLLRCGDKKTYKMAVILGAKVNAVIDSGSDLHLMTSSLYLKLGAPLLKPSTVRLDGVGSTGMSTLGKTSAEVLIDGMSFNFDFEVVPDYYVGHELIIGGELSDYAEVRLTKRQVTLSRIPDVEESSDETYPEILNINILDEPEDDMCVVGSDVTDPEVKEQLNELVQNYTPSKSKNSGVKLHIMLKDEMPVHQHPRRLSHMQKEIVNGIISDWQEKGVVRPSISEYASPIVLVEKRNNTYRLCVDYRELNKKVLRDRNPLPLIEDQIDKLQDAKIFSTLDLKDGFFHVPVDEGSIKYTSFVVPDGQWEFCKMPFGFANSPAVFQRHIRAVFNELIKQGVVLVYLDDLIIPALGTEEALCKLEMVLKTASDYGLIINWQKCKLLVRTVEYLGYVVEEGRYYPSDRKTTAVSKFPVPKTTKQVQSFLGLTGYFRKFIPQFAVRARPLSNLLRGDTNFQFGQAEKAAFEDLKSALLTKPVLQLYRVDSETELHTDACMGGLGAILLQKNYEDGRFHPVYFASWKTNENEEKYTSFELEFLAVVKAVKKFRVYLLGIPFKIVTDCQAFAFTLKKKDSCLRVSHWVLLLEQFKYTVEHRPGTSMKHVDALSRNPVTVMCVSKSVLMAKIKGAQLEDESLRSYFEKAKQEVETEFELKGDGVLYRVKNGIEQLVIPHRMQTEVIRQAHERGHFGWRKTEYLLAQEYWFPHMHLKVQKFILNCVKCILAEKKSGKAEGWLSPITKGETPLDTYHVDFLGPIPSTIKKYNHLYVVIDAFTKFAWIYPTKSVTAEEAISCLKRQATVFGNPRRIVSDRGSAFTSNAFSEYCRNENVNHLYITTGVPRGNGQVERLNRVIIAVLTKLSLDKPTEWYKHVNSLQQMLNSTFQRSIGRTPFELLVGTKMKLKDDMDLKKLIEKEVIECYESERSELREEARANLLKVQEENRKTYDRKRKKPIEYNVGDLVAVQRTQFGAGLKVAPKFLGPYEVKTAMKNNRYIVQKVGMHEGPNTTSTSADLMKPWSQGDDPTDDHGDDDLFLEDEGA